MAIPSQGGGDHAQTGPMGGDRRRERQIAPLIRVLAAWGAIFLAGSSLMLTGQLDWWGYYGERVVHAIALGAAGVIVWGLGERSGAERRACWAMLAFSLLALALAPGPGMRLEFNAAVALVHLGLCWQLLAWALVARKAQKHGLWIIAAGVAIEALVVMPLAQFMDVDAVCSTGSRLSCFYGAWVAVALPLLITLALIIGWLKPIERRLRDGRGGR